MAKLCKLPVEVLYYVENTLAHGWSHSVLVHQIESGLWPREDKLNFHIKAVDEQLRGEGDTGAAKPVLRRDGQILLQCCGLAYCIYKITAFSKYFPHPQPAFRLHQPVLIYDS